jgi:large subunit ribosomal protein L4
MKEALIDITGKKKGQIDLPNQIFAAKINQPLLAQAVRVYLSNRRQAHPKTKTRGEIKTSHHKLWRQKGTGRARHGSKNAPLFVGGAVAHGPRGNQNYKKRLPKKMKRLALFSALSSKLKDKEIIFLDSLKTTQSKTKEIIRLLKTIVPNFSPLSKILIVLPENQSHLNRIIGNLTQVSALTPSQLNPYQILNTKTMIFTKDSLEKLKQTLLAPKPKRTSKSK